MAEDGAAPAESIRPGSVPQVANAGAAAVSLPVYN
jgi:hypothetical protein